MLFTSIAAAALFAAAPVAASGSAFVVNKCDFNISLWSVSADTTTLERKTILPGTNYSEAYQTPSVGGVSLKLTTTDDCEGPITQFEYTLDGSIWYDISNVNCVGTECPFQKYGMYLEAGSGCPTRSCSANETTCSGAYNAYNDDWNSLSCESSSDIELYLCAEEAPAEEETQSKRAPEEYGVPAHRRRHAKRHGHPHARR